MIYYELNPSTGASCKVLITNENGYFYSRMFNYLVPDPIQRLISEYIDEEVKTEEILRGLEQGDIDKFSDSKITGASFSNPVSLQDHLLSVDTRDIGEIFVSGDRKHIAIVRERTPYFIQYDENLFLQVSLLNLDKKKGHFTPYVVYEDKSLDIVKAVNQIRDFQATGKPRYTQSVIPKKSGEKRIIKAPHPDLKEPLQLLSSILQGALLSTLCAKNLRMEEYQSMMLRNISYSLTYKKVKEYLKGDFTSNFYGALTMEDREKLIEKYAFIFKSEFNNPSFYYYTVNGLLTGKGPKRFFTQFPRIAKSLAIFSPIPIGGRDDYLLTAYTGMSVNKNASYHSMSDQIIKFDLQDFFPSIKWETVRDIFVLLLGEDIKDHLELIRFAVTDDSDSLYIGNPMSPVLANLVLIPVVKYLMDNLWSTGIRFTIYADDVTFSRVTVGKDLIPVDNNEYFNIKYLTNILTEALNQVTGSQLRINKKKTKRMNTKGALITGVRIADDRSVTTPRKYRQRIRAIKHQLEQNQNTFTTKESLEGMDAWAKSFDKKPLFDSGGTKTKKKKPKEDEYSDFF